MDIDAGDRAVEGIKDLAASTFRPEVLQGPGGFGGLFAPALQGHRSPVLVAGCDGVGTKLKIAFALGKHDTVGLDLVAMCVNDVLVQGAEPLFFLDYLAVGRLDPGQVDRSFPGWQQDAVIRAVPCWAGRPLKCPGFIRRGSTIWPGLRWEWWRGIA